MNWLLLEYNVTGLCFVSFNVLELLPEINVLNNFKLIILPSVEKRHHYEVTQEFNYWVYGH